MGLPPYLQLSVGSGRPVPPDETFENLYGKSPIWGLQRELEMGSWPKLLPSTKIGR
jgi:hypothetical protein